MQKPDTVGAGVPAVAAEDVAEDVATDAAVADATEDEEGAMDNWKG